MMSRLRLSYFILTLCATLAQIYVYIWPMPQGLFHMILAAGTLSPLHSAFIPLITFVIWVFAETFVRRNWEVLMVLPIAAFNFSIAFPLYLFLRSAPLK